MLTLTNPVVIDFEFKSADGCVPVPHTMCAKELSTGIVHRYACGQLEGLIAPPFPRDYTLVAFAADAELGCYLALGWPLPPRVIDLRIEHMMWDLNTSVVEHLGANLEGALAFYGISHASENKKEMQKLGGRGGPYTPEQVTALADYCMQDVIAEEKLLTVLMPKLDESSLYRGRYMNCVATIHHRGIPFDVTTLDRIKSHAKDLKLIWIRKFDPDCEIFNAAGTYKVKLFTEYLRKRGLLDVWPRTPKKKEPTTNSDDLRGMYLTHADNKDIANLIELFNTISLLDNFNLYVGLDGRNRVKQFNPFGSKTGRNQQKGFVFGKAKWVRSLLKPAEGHAIAYLDWNSMEVGVAAHYAQDPNLLEAYASGDAHMFLAKAAKAVPQDATKDRKKTTYPPEIFEQHLIIRYQYKTCDLAAMYDATYIALMRKGLTREMARTTLRHHHKVYSRFWEWISDRIEEADIRGEASTDCGWQIKVDAEARNFNSRSVGNFFIQAGSAELMRLACILAVEQGLGVCAIIHDAFLLEAPIKDMQRQVDALCKCMNESCNVLLDGFLLGIDGWQRDKWVVYPDRYLDERGKGFWVEIQESLGLLEEKDVIPSVSG